MSATHAFPQPDATDSDSVADALDSGLLHWVKGQIPEALHCLRAAGTASSEAGNEQRALDLARMADELAAKQASAPPTAPAVTVPSSTAPTATPAITTQSATTVVSEPAVATPAASGSSTDESKPQPAQTAEPRRSKLPEPRSGPKKFTGGFAHTAPALDSGASADGSRRPSAAGTKTSVAPTTTAARNSFAAQASTAPEPRVTNRPQTMDHRLASVRVKIERVEADGTVRVRLLDLAATASGEDNALLVVSQNLWQELKRGS